jgi:hypothetical protein
VCNASGVTTMTSVRIRSLAGFVLAVARLHLAATTAFADDPPGGPYVPGGNMTTVVVTRVSSGPSGVTIHMQVRETRPGSSTPASASGQPGGGGRVPSCSATPANIGNASVVWFQTGAAANPGRIPYALYCDGAFQGIVWLPSTTDPSTVRVAVDPGGSVDSVALAQSLLSRIPLPEITIGVNPSTGLVALPSWFWVDGYDGAPITASASLGGVTVTVELTPDGYRWRFGDGGELATQSLGRRYPERSDLTHQYEQSSLQAGGAYTVRLEVTFRVRFLVSGGGAGELPPITRTYTADYRVQQAQAVLTGR